MHAFVVWQIHVCLFICFFGVLGENTEDEIKPGGEVDEEDDNCA